ncbi:hypothetical protein F511_12477 [Dorcoceras hygrometricum]|uniref:Uncharacterized protein n=1 Tax=Dorcoceras hygrometricum TaxID=472368 RepID=A0A2Z7DDU6_9LAMI|nr:hypothetical protein F511_12477 [Dorcoceras hygrometricum]
MVKRLATSAHDPLGITYMAYKNQLVMVSIQYGSFISSIPTESMTITKSRVAIDSIAMHTSWRSNNNIAYATSIGYTRTRASGESSTTKHRLIHASGPHPILPPDDPTESSCYNALNQHGSSHTSLAPFRLIGYPLRTDFSSTPIVGVTSSSSSLLPKTARISQLTFQLVSGLVAQLSSSYSACDQICT